MSEADESVAIARHISGVLFFSGDGGILIKEDECSSVRFLAKESRFFLTVWFIRFVFCVKSRIHSKCHAIGWKGWDFHCFDLGSFEGRAFQNFQRQRQSEFVWKSCLICDLEDFNFFDFEIH
jgi:hypothetical protein